YRGRTPERAAKASESLGAQSAAMQRGATHPADLHRVLAQTLDDVAARCDARRDRAKRAAPRTNGRTLARIGRQPRPQLPLRSGDPRPPRWGALAAGLHRTRVSC